MKKIGLFLILLIFTSSCGFKVIDMSEQNNFSIVNIETIGESKINYIIKNKLLKSTKKEINKINIKLETEKIRNIKEKNIKNEITKYEILINVNVVVVEDKNKKEHNIDVRTTGDYSVAEQNSATRNNEKQLIKLLANSLSDKILNEINLKLNDN
mgnify:CR=1 FL=1|tara:strand:- start:144 stop:608 length:465 start_codon:yes stop_codon:yes gene_type:complete